MAEDLGEVRVRIEEEGAQDAADTIGDAVGDTGEGGGGGGGTVGGMLGGISAKLAAILGFVAFLASLKPIQEILSGLQRLFSVAILPLVALLNTFLRPILQKLLLFIANLDFDNLLQDLTTKLSTIASDIATDIVSEIPGIGNETAGEAVDFAGGTIDRFGDLPTSAQATPQIGLGIAGAQTLFNEFSPSTSDNNASDTLSEVAQFWGVGGQ